MNVITLGARISKEANKLMNMHVRMSQELGTECTITMEECILRAQKSSVNYAVIGQTAVAMMKDKFLELGLIENKAARTFFITIRPDTNKVTFENFYNDVRVWTLRKCVQNYTLTFEQKGTNEETLGQGFHVHIVAKMTQRSKGEVARDTHSSFKAYTAAQCVQVDICQNPDQHIQRYLIDYESKDGHKIVTKEWDTIWRTNLSLEPTYVDSMPTSLSSPGRLVAFL